MNAINKVVIIGGTSGMGLAIAQHVLNEGAKVVIVGRSQQRLDNALNILNSDDAETFVADIGDQQQVKNFFGNMKDIDHVVVTAADIPYGPTSGLTEADLMRGIKSKLLGPIFVAQECVSLLPPHGSIVFTSGIANMRPIAGGATTAALNGAIEGLCRALALEYAPIRVNAIAPGWTDTPFWDGVAGMTPEKKNARFNELASRLPTRRIGLADDIAESVIYLMRNGFTSGSVLRPDGGHQLV